MVQHNGVPTTCTASLLTSWHIPGLLSNDPKTQVNTRLKTVNDLIHLGYKKDFAILHIFVTDTQMKANGLDEFFPKIGFELVFKGTKFDDEKTNVHRHKETGDLYLWATTPKAYEEALKSYKKELEDLKDKIDPPKKPDPKRQAFPDLLLSHLRKANMVVDNAKVDNPLNQILLVDKDKLAVHIKMKFGFDPRKHNNWGDSWLTRSVRSLKEAQQVWKNELV